MDASAVIGVVVPNPAHTAGASQRLPAVEEATPEDLVPEGAIPDVLGVVVAIAELGEVAGRTEGEVDSGPLDPVIPTKDLPGSIHPSRPT